MDSDRMTRTLRLCSVLVPLPLRHWQWASRALAHWQCQCKLIGASKLE